MLVPVPGVIAPTRGILSFGYRRSPTHTHQGIDLHAPIGTPVYAAASGTVVRAFSNLAPGFSGYGRGVVVDGGGVWFLYSHMDKVGVRVGQRVAKGSPLGTVGRTCFNKSNPQKLCNRPHVHFEVSPRPYPQGSEMPRLDPAPWLQDVTSGGSGWGLALSVAVGGLGYYWWKRRRR